MKRMMAGLALLLLVIPMAFPSQLVRGAANVDVTVRIRCVLQVENPDVASGDGDYFPEVKIGGYDASSSPDFSGPLGPGPIEDDSFCPDWRFTRSVDPTVPLSIDIKLWDYDSGLNGGNDLMDISPTNQKDDLSLTFDAQNDTWAVPGSEVQGTLARGDGDPNYPDTNDGKIAQIDFEVYVGTNPDIDGDGIADAVELNGIRRLDGSMVVDLKALGADPCRKTIIMWIDYMTGAADGHSHEPKADAITAVQNTFNKAPVNAVAACPYPGTHQSTGIDYIFLKGKPVPEQAVMGLDDAYRAARAANFPPELRPYAHYAIFVHDQKAGSSSSGLCCEAQDGNKDLLVSLGSWRSTCVDAGANGVLDTTPVGDDVVIGTGIDVGPDRTCNTTAAGDDSQDLTVGTGAADARVGTANDQAGTILHELGHALGMGHGGDEKTNYMPDYISGMNYAFQFGIPRGATPAGASTPPKVLDYSSAALANLDKTKLKESFGVGGGTQDWTRWTDPAGKVRWGSASGAIDWDFDGKIDTGSVACGDGTNNCVAVNINADDDSGAPKTILSGYDDWKNIKFRAADAPGAGAENATPHPDTPDLDFPTTLQQEAQFQAAFNPDLAAAKAVDKANAQGGDPLVYTVTMQNVGPGVASNVSLIDTFPAGQGKTTETRAIGTLYPDAQNVQTFNLTVACTTTDGTLLTNSATVSGTDMGGGAEDNLANNTATASTTVHAPKLTVSKTASGSGLAGETITYTITVSNTGSAAATNVQVTDVLPVDVYYSKALDQGSGPQPGSVTSAANGTTTLTWSLGTLAGSAAQTIQYTARPSLLFLGGESVTNGVTVTYQNANGCTFAPVTAAAATTLTVTAPTRDPLTVGFWKNHPELWSAEFLARIQATDQRFDLNGDGQLSGAEATTIFNLGGNMDSILQQQLLATYFNLASRRINAATQLDAKAKLVQLYAFKNVRDAAIFARQTLKLPVNSTTKDRYSNSTTLLDLINSNKIEIY